MEVYGKKKHCLKTHRALKNLFSRKSGYICLSMGKGHRKSIKSAEQYPENSMVIKK